MSHTPRRAKVTRLRRSRRPWRAVVRCSCGTRSVYYAHDHRTAFSLACRAHEDHAWLATLNLAMARTR